MECAAFVKGRRGDVEYMVEARDVEGLKSALNDMPDAKEFEIPVDSPPRGRHMRVGGHIRRFRG